MKKYRPAKHQFLVFEVTPSCNNKCTFCYNIWHSDKSLYQESNELEINDIFNLFTKILIDFKRNNLVLDGVTLAGGESLLYPEIIQLVRFLRDKGLMVNIATNGILLNNDVTSKFKTMGVRHYEISLPSSNRENYKYITGTDALERVKESLIFLKQTDPEARITLAFTVTKLVYQEIEDLIDLAFALSADCLILNRFVPGGRGLVNEKLLIPDREELMHVLEISNLKCGQYSIPVDVTIPIGNCYIPHNRYPFLNFSSCLCGLRKWTIDYLGNLRICEQNPNILGNLFESEIVKLMQSESVTKFRVNNKKSECRTCEKYYNCGGGCRFSRNP